ncbi:hypothetical protein LEMLEM_LOCUS15825 [Lemmus lemmus]
MRTNGPTTAAVGPAALFFQIRGSQKPLRAFVTNFRSSLDFRRHFRVKDPEPRHRPGARAAECGGGGWGSSAACHPSPSAAGRRLRRLFLGEAASPSGPGRPPRACPSRLLGGPPSRSASPGDLARFRLLGGTPLRAREGWTPRWLRPGQTLPKSHLTNSMWRETPAFFAGAVRRDLDSPDRPGDRT